ncbi:hypothetical protein FHW83_005456 [Duganella sp. SG902]|uniref:hypothetical protein n=1 Tax=Duganella sp. SG902 TaxID=2587016 RepID=UPI00159DB5F9|nr:hypothetical protein [Duganella sp. SG902]NVM79615.1 hypothetical protein [Duganella sp. SG902]
MDTKAILRGIEEFRKYLLGEAPMLVGGAHDDIADLVPTYFKGKLPPDAEIWQLFEYVKENPALFEAELEERHREILRAHRAWVGR